MAVFWEGPEMMSWRLGDDENDSRAGETEAGSVPEFGSFKECFGRKICG